MNDKFIPQNHKNIKYKELLTIARRSSLSFLALLRARFSFQKFHQLGHKGDKLGS